MENIPLSKQQLSVVYVPIDDLKPAEYNPRTNTDKQEEGLKNSLQNFDMVEPLVVNSAENRKNIIIGGHFRWRIAKKRQCGVLLTVL